MPTVVTCPRGHELEPNAVLCTVCWIRVEPVDPEVEATRRRRQRRIWLPMVGTAALLVGVFLGGSLGLLGGGSSEPTVTAADAPVEVVAVEAAPVEAAPVEAAPTSDAVDEPVAAPAATPEAVAVVEAATTTDWTQALCVPADAVAFEVSARAIKKDPWSPVEAAVAVEGTAECAADEAAATVAVVSLPDGATKVRVVSRDAAGDKLAKAKLDVGER